MVALRGIVRRSALLTVEISLGDLLDVHLGGQFVLLDR